MHEYKGSLDASGKRFAVVAARFNEPLVTLLAESAVDCLQRLGAEEGDVELFWVPGSFEVPGTSLACARSGHFDAVIALGVLIRGATAHFDLVAHQAAAGIAGVFRETGVPCIFGIVTAETVEQAQERCGTKMGNRGWDAAQAAVEMANLGEAFNGWPTTQAPRPEAAAPKAAAPGKGKKGTARGRGKS